MLPVDLTESGNIFERDLLGISLRDADQLHVLTGCRKLEEYLVRIALNEKAFRELVN